MTEPTRLAELLYCRRCGRELAEHRVSHDEEPPPGLLPARFTFDTTGLYCP